MNLYETILSLFINIYFPIYSHIHIQISMHNIHICICINRKKSGKRCIKMLKVVICGSKIYFHLCLFKYFYKFTFIILLIFKVHMLNIMLMEIWLFLILWHILLSACSNFYSRFYLQFIFPMKFSSVSLSSQLFRRVSMVSEI